MKVFGIELVDDHYGIIVACRKERKRYDFPLVELKVTEKLCDISYKLKLRANLEHIINFVEVQIISITI